MIKKILSTIIAAALTVTSVSAASLNTLSRSNVLVKDESSLAFVQFQIVPLNEVETGSSIVLSFTNATVFQQDIIDGTSTDKEEYGYNETGYQYLINGEKWDRNKGFYDVMPSLDSAQLPYYIRRINDKEIEVFLINVPDVCANNSLSNVNNIGRTPYYSIPIVAYADGVGDITATIDSNGTSITGGSIGNAQIFDNSKDENITTTEATTEAATISEETTEATTSAPKTVKVQIGSDTIDIDGVKTPIDAPAYIQEKSQSTMIPLRAVSEVFGDVEWVAETKTAIVKYNGNVVEFTAGSDTMIINNVKKPMDNGVTAEITNSRMFVPFRALGEALGLKVEWIAETKTAVYTQ